MAATVRASRPAPAGPSTVPQATPDGVDGRTGMDETSDAHGPSRYRGTRPVPDDPVRRVQGGGGHNGGVASSLSRVPVEKRKQLAATLGLFAVLFVAVAAVSATGPRLGVHPRVHDRRRWWPPCVLGPDGVGRRAHSIRARRGRAPRSTPPSRRRSAATARTARTVSCAAAATSTTRTSCTSPTPSPNRRLLRCRRPRARLHPLVRHLRAGGHAPVAEPHARRAPAGLTV